MTSWGLGVLRGHVGVRKVTQPPKFSNVEVTNIQKDMEAKSGGHSFASVT